MPIVSKQVLAFPAALFAFALFSACGEEPGSGAETVADTGSDTAAATPLFPDDFAGVCSGASQSRATAYDPAGGPHKALYFETYRDDLMDQSSNLPADWTVQWSESGDALAAIDLVVCARRTAAQEVKVCDGYESDGAPTDNRVRWHTATYELSVREATTGNVLATTTAEGTGTDCPMFQNFDGTSDTVDGYAGLSDTQIADFLGPHMAP